MYQSRGWLVAARISSQWVSCRGELPSRQRRTAKGYRCTVAGPTMIGGSVVLYVGREVRPASLPVACCARGGHGIPGQWERGGGRRTGPHLSRSLGDGQACHRAGGAVIPAAGGGKPHWAQALDAGPRRSRGRAGAGVAAGAWGSEVHRGRCEGLRAGLLGGGWTLQEGCGRPVVQPTYLGTGMDGRAVGGNHRWSPWRVAQASLR